MSRGVTRWSCCRSRSPDKSSRFRRVSCTCILREMELISESVLKSLKRGSDTIHGLSTSKRRPHSLRKELMRTLFLETRKASVVLDTTRESWSLSSRKWTRSWYEPDLFGPATRLSKSSLAFNHFREDFTKPMATWKASIRFPQEWKSDATDLRICSSI